MSTPMRVLVCDDSKTFGAALQRMLERSGEIEVVGVRTTAESAIAAMPELDPDLVTMDIHLPGMSGLEAVEQIMSVRPTPILVLSSYTREGGNAAAALAAGALEAIGKDDLALREPDGDAAVAFRRRVTVLGRARVVRHPRGRLPRPSPRGGTSGAVVAICASTGGPQALAAVLAGLPAGYPAPVLVVQHIAAGFTDGLVRWLDRVVPLPVRLAEDGAVLEPGVTFAPGGAHLRLCPDRTLRLDREAPAGPHRPSADVLLGSVAASAGRAAIAVVLTGMGDDGSAGVAAVRRAGGLTVAQDEASSAVYGMPRAAARRGAELILPLGEIADALRRAAHRVGA